jgi:methionyl-tRNA formyltransferase
MNIIFCGSPTFALPSLHALQAAGHHIVAVYTQPPRPAGRGQQLTPTPVAAAAQHQGLPIYTPEKLTGEALSTFLSHPAQVVVVVGYGLLLPKAVVENKICLNVHPSDLPRWRGATPVQSALLAGDTSTAVCIMRLDEGMDTGPIYSRTPLTIPADMSAGQLNDIIWAIGAQELVKVVSNLEHLTPTPQVGEATRALKITRAMRPISWAKTAQEIHNHIRALAPKPGATSQLGGEDLKIIKAETTALTTQAAVGTMIGFTTTGAHVACGQGTVLHIVALQRPGKTAQPVTECAKGWPTLAIGAQFT